MTIRGGRIVVGCLWLVLPAAAQISAAHTSVSSSVSAQVPPLIQRKSIVLADLDRQIGSSPGRGI